MASQANKACVLLEGTAVLTIKELNECLDLAHGDFPFNGKVEAVQRSSEAGNEDWVVQFTDKISTKTCLRQGSWDCTTSHGTLTIFPTVCPPSLIPEHWVKLEGGKEEWQMVSPDPREGFHSLSEDETNEPFQIINKENTTHRMKGEDIIKMQEPMSEFYSILGDEHIRSGDLFGDESDKADKVCSMHSNSTTKSGSICSGKLFGDGAEEPDLDSNTISRILAAAAGDDDNGEDTSKSLKQVNAKQCVAEARPDANPELGDISKKTFRDSFRSCDMFGSGPEKPIRKMSPSNDKRSSISSTKSADLFGSGSDRNSSTSSVLLSTGFEANVKQEASIDDDDDEDDVKPNTYEREKKTAESPLKTRHRVLPAVPNTKDKEMENLRNPKSGNSESENSVLHAEKTDKDKSKETLQSVKMEDRDNVTTKPPPVPNRGQRHKVTEKQDCPPIPERVQRNKEKEVLDDPGNSDIDASKTDSDISRETIQSVDTNDEVYQNPPIPNRLPQGGKNPDNAPVFMPYTSYAQTGMSFPQQPPFFLPHQAMGIPYGMPYYPAPCGQFQQVDQYPNPVTWVPVGQMTPYPMMGNPQGFPFSPAYPNQSPNAAFIHPTQQLMPVLNGGSAIPNVSDQKGTTSPVLSRNENSADEEKRYSTVDETDKKDMSKPFEDDSKADLEEGSEPRGLSRGDSVEARQGSLYEEGSDNSGKNTVVGNGSRTWIVRKDSDVELGVGASSSRLQQFRRSESKEEYDEDHVYTEINTVDDTFVAPPLPQRPANPNTRDIQGFKKEVHKKTPKRYVKSKVEADNDGKENNEQMSLSGRSSLRVISVNEEEAEEKNETDSKDRSTCIKVVNFSEEISTEHLELFFENPKKCGGDTIVSLKRDSKKNCAIIEYSEPEVVQKVLKMQEEKVGFILSGHSLMVTEYVPPPMEPCKVFVTGLGEATSKESLALYVENVYGMEMERVDYGETPGTAILTFASKIDFEKLRRGFQRRSLEGNHITANEVEVTRSIKVKGYKPTASVEALTYFFENKRRSKGGFVEDTRLHNDMESFIVTFVNAEDAVRVSQQEGLKLDDQELSISLYYPCLDPDPDTVVSVPEPLELNSMENYITRFLKGSEYYKNIVEKRIGDLQGKVVWPENKEDCIRLICLVDPKGVGAKKRIAQWTDKCGEVIADIKMDIEVNDNCSVAKEIWSEFLGRLQEINISNPELLTVFLQQEDETVIIVGQTALVQALARQVKSIATDLEKKLEVEKQTVTKSKRVKFYQWALLHALRLPDTWKKSKVEVSLTGENREIVFKGQIKDVDEAIDKMYQRMNACPKKLITGYDKEAVNLLFEPTMRDYIKKEFSKRNVIGIWDRDKDSLYLYSKNDKDLSVAESVFKNCLKQWSLELTSKTWKQIQSQAGKALKEQAQLKHEGRVRFVVQPTQLLIIAAGDVIQSVKEEVESFFELHADVQEFLSVDLGKLRFVMEYRKDDLRAIEDQYLKLNVRIEPVEKQARCGFKVSGKKDGCKLAIQKLEGLIVPNKQKNKTLEFPGVRKFFESKAGDDERQNLEMKEECLIFIKPSPSASSRASLLQELASCHVYNTKLVAMAGDITKLHVDAIVVPSFSTLMHSSGLGEAVVAKGGFDIQKECSAHVNKGGPLTMGDVFCCKAGRLPCRYVLNAVISPWNEGLNNERSLLVTTITNCLEAAVKKGCSSVAFPLVGTGRFQYPTATAVGCLATAFKSHMRIGSKINKIYLCELRQQLTGKFVEEMKVVFPGQVEMSAANLEDYGAVSREENEYGVRTSKGPRQRNSGSVIQVDVVEGELAKQDVDVIVNSTNQTIDLRVGAVSTTLLKAGGEGIQKECLKNYPNGIKYGDVAITTGGSLKCRHLFHGMLAKWDQGQGHAEKVMSTFVTRCLQNAETLKLKSLAFPALGTGILGFPADKVARLMYECVQDYQQQNPSTKIRQVSLVVWSGDTATSKAFQREERLQKTGSVSRPKSSRSSMTLAEDAYSSLPESRISIGSGALAVEFVEGDITQEKTGVIVNSVLKDLNLSYGNVSKAILQAAGQSIQDECRTKANIARIEKDGLVVTSGGRLYCQKIIHLKSRSSSDKWKQTILKCLQEVEFLGINSVAFPALGTGGKGCRPESVARAMHSAFQEFENSKNYRKCLKLIRVVIYQTEMLEKFISEFSEGSKRSSNLFPRHKPVEEKKESVTVYIYSDSTHKINKAEEALENLFDVAEMKVHNSLMEQMETRQVNKIKDMASHKNVEIGIDHRSKDTIIKLKGPKISVEAAEKSIKAYIRNIDRDLQKLKTLSPVAFPKTWTIAKIDDKPMQVPLLPADPEYIKVSAKFMTEARYAAAAIVTIERIENPALYIRYIGKKHEMNIANPGVQNERILWHGTRGDVIPSINSKGFNRNYNSGSSHGVGVYFAVNASTSVSGYCRPDANGHKHVYMAQVLTGEFGLGRNGIRVPPTKPGSSQLVTYDSTADNVTAPTFFVIFHDDQAYPTYLVTFK